MRDPGEENPMIARTWRGAVRRADADDYASYPEDDGFLVQRDATSDHYEVVSARGVAGA
jgi:hypothetical protein